MPRRDLFGLYRPKPVVYSLCEEYMGKGGFGQDCKTGWTGWVILANLEGPWEARMVLWIMVFAQMAAWAWFSYKGGKVEDKKFLYFTGAMLLGQLASCIEAYQTAAWRTLVAQIYFFAFTAFGGIQRFRQMRKTKEQL